MTLLKQTELKYKNIRMGLGSGSIFDYGCYLVGVCNLLVIKGWDVTPEGLNELFKEKGLWTGEFKNYIDTFQLSTKLPDMFSRYTRIEPFTNTQLTEAMKLSVIAKVDARGIGGSGTHFVVVTEYDGKVATIFDPWYGEEVLVTKRYGKYGNLLGLRIFDIKGYNKPMSANLIDLEKDLPSWVESNYRLKDIEGYDNHGNFGKFVTLVKDTAVENGELTKEVEKLLADSKLLTVRDAQKASTISERDKQVTTLVNEINRLKNDLTALQADVDTGEDSYSILLDENTKLLIENKLLRLRLLEQPSLISSIIEWLKNLKLPYQK